MGDARGSIRSLALEESAIHYFIVFCRACVINGRRDCYVMHSYCSLTRNEPFDENMLTHFPSQLAMSCTVGTNSTNARSMPSPSNT